MLALRLTRAARPAVQLRRLLVAVAAAGTGFLMLACLGYALHHPERADAAALRLAWSVVPFAATVYFALAVARTDPGTRPRPGLSAVGVGPARLMAVCALTTALSCTLGSLLALLVFLHLRGDLTGMPFDGAAADFLAADQSLPVPAAMTLLALLPAVASTTVAVALRPKDPRPTPILRMYGRFGAYGHPSARETFGAYGRFGARSGRRPTADREAAADRESAGDDERAAQDGGQDSRPSAGGRAAGAAPGSKTAAPDSETAAPGSETDGDGKAPSGESGPEPPTPDADWTDVTHRRPHDAPAGLPWGIALLTTGLTVQSYAGRSNIAVLTGWLVTAAGLVLASPGLTHLCGRFLQCTRPGALRLLAGRVLMTEATRIGRPLGVVSAVTSAGYAMTTLYAGSAPSFGPLTALGATLVTGCTVATVLTAAVETRQCRADTTAALLRLGAPAWTLRTAATLRAVALLALFGSLTLVVAALSALPVDR
ncbi:hypothetical protein [Streptomyces roseochromogenus]|uniref:Uncharacterized protein n=1 Tax=Streptomyces roseochromogenus subsp. oscitans DS 12.976 TaxID=1352936 RepID=V6KNL7_STRRC|nr:hypothetical protein [Streptomyces roseochromogenus]EST33765.1 hypothetical protein M878_12015 [Streptomyces roseochromogenus subsp. oscitans DS 12.976]